jgi:exoribonuclease R
MYESNPEGVLETKNYTDFQIRNDAGEIILEFQGAAKAAKALPGDRVEWRQTDGKCSLVSRTKQPVIAGTLELNSKTKYGMTSRGSPLYLFIPFNKAYPMMIVGSSERDTSKNLIALVDFDDWTTTGLPRGTLRRVLGPVGTPDAEKEALLWTYNSFQYGSRILQTVLQEQSSSLTLAPSIRETHPKMTFNIDPAGCQDVDDVLGLHIGEDTVELWITIADVAEVVKEGSVLDTCARQQGATCYENGSAIRPMLPFAFSEDTCSLLPGGASPGVSLVLTYTKGNYAEPVSKRWVECTVQNDKNYTYEEFIQAATADGIPVWMLHKMAKGLYDKVLYTDTHTWVEAFMLTYNLEVAKVLRKAKAGILRKHSAAEYERLLTYSMWGVPALAQQAAEYCPANDPSPLHYGLTAEVYCHATSPIRRYADLVNQRVLKKVIRGEELFVNVDSRLLTHLNRRQTDLKRFERDAFLLQHVQTSSGTIDVLILERTARTIENHEALFTKLKVWVPKWKRCLCWTTTMTLPPELVGGLTIRLSYFANPTIRCWKDRIAFRFEEIVVPH